MPNLQTGILTMNSFEVLQDSTNSDLLELLLEEDLDVLEPEDYIDRPSWESLYDSFSTAERELTSELGFPPAGGPHQSTKVVDFETGDDKSFFSRNRRMCTAIVFAIRYIMRMCISENDTGITLGIWDYCSVMSELPIIREETYHVCRKSGNYDNLGFNDFPPLNRILPNTKTVLDSSVTASGKASWFRMRSHGQVRSCFRSTISLASFFQDGMFRMEKAPEPKYLPGIVGGMGVNAPFQSSMNLLAYVHVYKAGTYARIYGSATAEIQKCLSELNGNTLSGRIPDCLLLCSRLRQKQSYLHGTYDNYVFVPKQLSENTAVPIYCRTSSNAFICGMEQRLLRARLLVGGREARIEKSKKQRFNELLLQIRDTSEGLRMHKELSQKARKNYDGALTAKTALQRLLMRKANRDDLTNMIEDEDFHTLTIGRKGFTKMDALVYTDPTINPGLFNLRSLPFPDDMYIAEEVSFGNTFKVPGIDLIDPTLGKYLGTTTTKVGLLNISSTMVEWGQRVVDRFRAARDLHGRPLTQSEVIEIYSMDTEWIEDDFVIASQAIGMQQSLGIMGIATNMTKGETTLDTYFILLSDDIRLGRKISNATGIPVAMIHPILFAKELKERGGREEDWNDLLITLSVEVRRSGFNKPLVLPFDKGNIQSLTLNIFDGKKHTLLDFDPEKRTAVYDVRHVEQVRIENGSPRSWLIPWRTNRSSYRIG